MNLFTEKLAEVKDCTLSSLTAERREKYIQTERVNEEPMSIFILLFNNKATFYLETERYDSTSSGGRGITLCVIE